MLDLSDQAWGFLGIFTIQICGVVVVWLKLRRQKDVVDETRDLAADAKEQTKPISNGFALKMTSSVERIEQGVHDNTRAILSLRDDLNEQRKILMQHLLNHHANGNSR